MVNIRQRLLASSILVAGLGLYLPVYKQIYRSAIQPFPEGYVAEYEEPIKPRKLRKPCYKSTLPSTSSQIGIAIAPDGKKVYQLTGNGITIVNKKTGRQRNFRLPRQFPELSWGTDIAYDSKRDIVSLVSLGGEGYFYRFDAKQRRWLDVQSLYNLDLRSLTYDRGSDRYIAWAEDFGQSQGSLVFISGTGELLYKESISDRMIGFDRIVDRGNEVLPVVEIIAQGDSLALMTYSGNSIQSIWHYNLYENYVRLTYKSPERSYVYSD